MKKRIFITLLLCILVILIIDVFYSKFIRKDQIVSLFGKAFLIVETGSMEPTINKGELVIISKKPQYKIGEIVTIIDQDEYIYTHRIVKKENTSVITKGDGNNIEDEAIDENYIFGRVIMHSKILGFFVLYLLKPLILIQIFTIVIFILKDFFMKEETNEENTNN